MHSNNITFRRKPAKTAAVLNWTLNEAQVFASLKTSFQNARNTAI